MEPNSDNQNDWQYCRPGVVGQLVRHLQSRRKAVVVQRRMVAAVLLIMAAFSSYYFVGVLPSAEPNYGGIVCSSVQELGQEYSAGTMDSEQAARVRAHLAQCEDCRQWMKAMAPISTGQADSTATASPNSFARLEPAAARPVIEEKRGRSSFLASLD